MSIETEPIEPRVHKKYTRCIICSDFTLLKDSPNVFNTTLDRGKLLLSDFIKNVLDCSVLIIVSPEFFVCKRCYTLCVDLDEALARCNDIQENIQELFKIGQRNQQLVKELEATGSLTTIKTEKEDEEEYFDPDDVIPEETYEDMLENETANGEAIEDIEYFLNHDVVESEVEIAESLLDLGGKIIDAERARNQSQEEEFLPAAAPEQEYMKYNLWRCRPCRRDFPSMEDLEDHKRTDECVEKCNSVKATYEFKNYCVTQRQNSKIFYCNHCTFESLDSATLIKHLESHKRDPLFMCDICGRRFKLLKTFIRHQQVHDESRPFPCKLCSFRAETELKLRIHQRLHDDQKKYCCSKCNYKTIKKMAFLIHSRKHTGERPYACPDCPYKAKDSSTMIRHRRIHGGIKRYHCTICDYKSVQKNSVRVHMMTHTGEKPHLCPHCDYRSTMKHNLDSHIAAKHSNEKPFACTQCPYRTKVKRILKHHIRLHTDDKPFSCKLCHDRFRYSGSLSYHMKTRHPKDGDGVLQRERFSNPCEMKKFHFQGDNVEFSEGESDPDDVSTTT